MNLGDLAGDLLGGLDVKKVAAVIDSIWDHRDDLARMAKQLPSLLDETGGHMQAAGEGAQRASAFLAGDVRDMATSAAEMLEATRDQLQSVLKSLEGIGKMLGNVPFIGDMTKGLGDGLGALSGVAENLDSVGQKVRGLGDRLGDVGGDLDAMGRSLLGGGVALSGFVGGSTARPVAIAFVAPAGAAVKKSAAKRRPAANNAAPVKKKAAPAKKAVAPKKATPAKKAVAPKRAAPVKKAPAAKKAAPAKKKSR